jgi:hypothetical protein
MPLPLKPISVETPFQQWGLDFIGEIHPPSSGQHKWILTTTDYFTKWIEVVPTRQATDVVIIKFLETNILSRFGCPRKIITDNANNIQIKEDGGVLQQISDYFRTLYCLLPSRKWISRVFQQESGQYHQKVVAG